MDVGDGPGVSCYFCGLNSCNLVIHFWAPLTAKCATPYGYVDGVYIIVHIHAM